MVIIWGTFGLEKPHQQFLVGQPTSFAKQYFLCFYYPGRPLARVLFIRSINYISTREIDSTSRPRLGRKAREPNGRAERSFMEYAFKSTC